MITTATAAAAATTSINIGTCVVESVNPGDRTQKSRRKESLDPRTQKSRRKESLDPRS